MQRIADLAGWRPRRSIADDCNSFLRVLGGLPMPLSPYDAGTRHVVGMLMEKHLDALLDHAFGPAALPKDGSDPRSWFQNLEAAPNAQDEEALIALLHPEGPLFRVLMELSPPVRGFDDMLADNWGNEFKLRPEGQLADAAEDAPFGDVSKVLPLTALSAISFLIMGEPKDVDLTTLPADKVPAWLVLPVWYPPIADYPAQNGPGSSEKLKSARMTPAAYFLARMLLHLRHAAGVPSAADELAAPEPDGWARRFDEKAAETINAAGALLPSWLVGPGPLVSSAKTGPPRMGLYHSLIQLYANCLAPRQPTAALRPSAAPQRLGGGGNLAGNSVVLRTDTWGTAETLGAAFVHGMIMSWPRFILPETEHDRGGLRDLSTLAVLLHALPGVTHLVLAMDASLGADAAATVLGTGADSNRGHLHGRYGGSGRGTVGGAAAGSGELRLVRDCVARPAVAAYRFALQMLRESYMSVGELAAQVPAHHAVSMLRLHAALLGPRGAPDAVLLHYEGYSLLLRDLLQCAVQSQAFLAAHINGGGHDAERVAAALAEVLAAVADTRTLPLVRHISEAIEAYVRTRAVSDVVARVRSHTVLRWADDGSANPDDGLVSVTSGECAALAAQLHGVLRARVADPRAEGDAHAAAIAAPLRDALASLSALVPDVARQRQPARTAGAAQPAMRADLTGLDDHEPRDGGAGGIRGGDYSLYGASRYGRRTVLLADRARSQPYAAPQGCCSADLSRDVVVDRAAARHRRSEDDVPWLLAATRVVDAAVFAARRWVAVRRRHVPRCPLGHVMELDDAPRAEGGWCCMECGSLRTAAAAPPTARTAYGYPIQPEDLRRSPFLARAVVCDQCCVLLPSPARDPSAPRRYFVAATETFLCAACGSVPFAPWSTRWLASARTWATIAIVIGLAVLVMWWVQWWAAAFEAGAASDDRSTHGLRPSSGPQVGWTDIDDML